MLTNYTSTIAEESPNNSATRECQWYVLYTTPRAEKVVFLELQKRRYEAFLPMTRTLHVWKNRQKKLVDEVLFPSYIFVNTHASELHNLVKLPRVCTYIHVAGKPATVAMKDIMRIKTMLSLNQEISVEANFTEGEKVRIVYGPLVGYEGVLVSQKGKTRFGIELKEINHTMFIDICTSVLERVDIPAFA